MSDLTTMAKLPAPIEVRELFEGLFGRDVDVAACSPYAPAASERATFAVYVDDHLTVRAVGVVDLPLSAYAGGALGLVPPAGVADAISEGLLPPNIEENLYEVLNICAALMNAEGLPHVKLYAMHSPAAPPPNDVAALASVIGRRLDLEVKIAGYGSGRMALVVVA